ncbi:hypothetical protein Esti_004830 [Eimeria stiedai]
MSGLHPQDGGALPGLSSFSQLCSSSPEGSQTPFVQRDAPQPAPALPPTFNSQSLILAGGIHLGGSFLDADSSEGPLEGPPPIQTAFSTPPKTARPSGARDRAAKGFRFLHAESKSSRNSSFRAARAFHSTGLDSMAAALAAASAAATAAAAPTEKKLTRYDVKGRQESSHSRFWLRSSEFSLLAELRACAREATATQIEGAAQAAAAAFRKQGAGLPSCAAEGAAPSAEESLFPTTTGLPPNRNSSPRSLPEWRQPSAGTEGGPSARDAAHSTTGALIKERGCTPAVVLGTPEVELGTWEEAESQEGPQVVPWRVYSLEAAPNLSFSSSAPSEATAGMQQQGTAMAKEDEVDSLPPTQKTQNDTAPAGDPPADAPAASQTSGSVDPGTAASCPAAAPPVSGACTIAEAALREKASVSAGCPDAAVGGRMSTEELNGRRCELGHAAATSEAAAGQAAQASAAAAANSQATVGAGPAGAAACADGLKECGLGLPEADASYLPSFSCGASVEALVTSQEDTASTDAATAARHPAAAAALPSAAPIVIAATRAAAAAAKAATAVRASEGRSMPSYGVESPYATTPRRGMPPAGTGFMGNPSGGPTTPRSASSSAPRRGRLKSTARLAASSLTRAAVEATARRFSRLPLGGDARRGAPESVSSAASKSRMREGLAPQGAQTETCSVGRSNRSNSSEESARLAAPGGDGSEGLHPVKRERLRPRVQQQPQQQQQQHQLQTTQQRARLLGASLFGEAEVTGDSAASGGLTAACKLEGGASPESKGSIPVAGNEIQTIRQGVSRGAPRQPFRAPRLAEAGQLKEALTRGLYGFQVEGLLWMLEREGRLPACASGQGQLGPSEVQLSSSSKSSALGGGGVLADEPGLGKTLQMISLIAATAQIPRMHAAATAQQQTDQPEGEERESRSLVLMPASLVLQWEAEIHRTCGLKLAVLNVPRRLKETGAVLSPSALKGVQVVLVSYEALLSVPCLCRPPRLPRDMHGKHRSQQQGARKPVAAMHDGLEEDPVFAMVASYASEETSGSETRQHSSVEELPWHAARTPGCSPRTSCCLGEWESASSSLSLQSTFRKKMRVHPSTPDAYTPQSARSAMPARLRGTQLEPASPNAMSAPQTPQRSSVALWGPRGPRCSCVRCFLVSFSWERLVLDEAHLVLRRRQLTSAIKAVTARYKWALTATPDARTGDPDRMATNDSACLLPLLGLLDLDKAAREEGGAVQTEVHMQTRMCCAGLASRATYCGVRGGAGRGDKLLMRRSHADVKQREAAGMHLCSTAQAVLQQMHIRVPARSPVLPNVELRFQMLSFASPREAELYKKIEGMASGQVASNGPEGTAPPITSLEWIVRLRQVCLHSCLVVGESWEGSKSHPASNGISLSFSQCDGTPKSPSTQHRRRLSLRSHGHEPGTPTQTAAAEPKEEACISACELAGVDPPPRSSTKTQAILSAVTSILNCNKRAKIVIVSTFTSFLKLLEVHLAEQLRLLSPTDPSIDSKVLKLTGETKIANRAKIIRRFATDQNCNILIVSSLSASHGVDGLQVAGHLLICEPMLTPGRVRQVLGRVARIGQTGQQVLVQLFFAFYVEEDKLTPVPPLECDQPPEKEYKKPAPPVHSLDQASQETSGRGTTASQRELMTEASTTSEPHTTADSDSSRLFSSGACAINRAHNLAERSENALRCGSTSDASKPAIRKESPQSACKFGFDGSLSFASSGGASYEIAKKAGDISELLSLWGNTKAPPEQLEEHRVNIERLLARLQQAGVQERLEKLTVLNAEVERIQSTVTFAEQVTSATLKLHENMLNPNYCELRS